MIFRFLILLLSICSSPAVAGAEWIVSREERGAVALNRASIRYDAGDARVVALAVADLASDLRSVTGRTAPVVSSGDVEGPAVIVGTLGNSAAVDALVAAGRVDVSGLLGAWESFVIATVDDDLVIVGSDRRGTAFGVYELAQAIGVSPWAWWADVAPAKREALFVKAGTRRFGPPSVKYRGIFINDEDWGLVPWASKTFDPEGGNLGPKTYDKVFALLLRLKANVLWPGMHPTTRPFNADPANARAADARAIVMGSSHAEPMLRNNVGEWTAAKDAFDYVANRDGVRRYWEERVRTNASYESLWTIGMRGIHDSGIVGVKTVPEKVRLLERIFADQRAMLDRHVAGGARKAPQLFMPYKEVLEVYRAGLKVPGDVTLVWPDDNFGYIRQLPTEAERARPGGSGIYYHLSYLGAPLSYLWLSTTPPALVQHEMLRAYDAGARTLWVANVGDIKPAEVGISHFLELAWDVEALRGQGQAAWLEDWSGRTFGAGLGKPIGAILDAHFTVNFERRPEHLQWHLPKEPARASGLSDREWDARLARFDAIAEQAEAVRGRVPTALRDAYFEIVDYPVQAAAAANMRVRKGEAAARTGSRAAASEAEAADARIAALTARYNGEIAGGKWRGIMAVEPADAQWKSYRTLPWVLPTALAPVVAEPETRVMEAEAGEVPAGWRRIAGLGRGPGSLAAGRGALMRDVVVPAGRWRLTVEMLPTYAADGGPLTLDVGIDGAAPVRVTVSRVTGDRDWADAVLDNRVTAMIAKPLAAGRHRVTIGAGDGVVIDRLVLTKVADGVALDN